MKIAFRKHFDYDAVAASNEAAIPPDGHGVSLTIQSHSEDADINEMMRRFKVTGQMPQNVRVPTYGDFEGIDNYQDAVHAIMAAHDSFDRMPAEVRARFDNDPLKFVDFCSNPDNIADMAKMGLAVEEMKNDSGKSVGSSGSESGKEGRSAGVGDRGDSGAA